MVTHTGLTADQKITGSSSSDLVTWTKQRQAGSGMTKVLLRDVHIDHSYDGSGTRAAIKFAYADYRVGIYKRGAAAGPVGSVIVRKHWGQNPGWRDIVNFGGGYFSIQTQLVAAYLSNGSKITFAPSRNPWVKGTFDIITG